MKNLSIEFLGNNCYRIWIQGSGWIAFSYKTIIAFAQGGRLVVRQNDWSNTTGKHLNLIDGGTPEAKKARMTSAEFESTMAEYEITFRRVFAGAPFE